MLKILAFAGSVSKDSINKKLINSTIPDLERIGYEVTVVDLSDYPLPVYNVDIKASEFPEAAIKLFNLMLDNPVWLISTADHNGSIPVCLKNLIDWVSRSPDNKPNLSAFKDKIVAIMSASPSMLGGSRSLKHLRDILTGMNCLVIPSQASVSNAYSAFDEQNNLTDVRAKKAVGDVLDKLYKISSKLLK